MFNVRPDTQSPWLHVEPPPVDEVPGFRMNPDGSIRNTPRNAPPGADPTALSGLSPPPRQSLQSAVDQIMRIYAPFATVPMVAPTVGQPPFPIVAASQAPRPAVPVISGSDKSGSLAIVERPSDTTNSNDVAQPDTGLATP